MKHYPLFLQAPAGGLTFFSILSVISFRNTSDSRVLPDNGFFLSAKLKRGVQIH